MARGPIDGPTGQTKPLPARPPVSRIAKFSNTASAGESSVLVPIRNCEMRAFTVLNLFIGIIVNAMQEALAKAKADER